MTYTLHSLTDHAAPPPPPPPPPPPAPKPLPPAAAKVASPATGEPSADELRAMLKKYKK